MEFIFLNPIQEKNYINVQNTITLQAVFFTFLAPVVSLGELLYTSLAGRRKFTELQNPWVCKNSQCLPGKCDSTSLIRNFAQLC